jgi:hypothetical protein
MRFKQKMWWRYTTSWVTRFIYNLFNIPIQKRIGLPLQKGLKVNARPFISGPKSHRRGRLKEFDNRPSLHCSEKE